MKKLLLLCSALALVSTTSHAATRLAHVTHIQDRGHQCQSSSNLLSSLVIGAVIGKILVGNDKGAIIGSALGAGLSNNTKTCYKVRTVFWRAESYGRSYRGQTNVKGNQYIGSTIYVDGLP